MTDYIHPYDFALLLKTTPYQVWMWLGKETNHEPTYMRIEQNPKLPSPEIWDRKQIPNEVLSGTPEVRHTKTVFLGTRKSKRPKPFDQESIFSLIEVNYCFKEKEDKYPLAMYFSEDAINIHIKSDEEGLTRVIGEYTSEWPELLEYMKQIRDALVKVFSEGERIQTSGNEISKEKAKRKARADMLQKVAEAYFLVNEKRYSRSEAAALMHTSTSSMATYDPQNEGEGNAIVKKKLEIIGKDKKEQSRIHLKAVEERKLKREK